ncbi:uncharacterized protein LOC110430130 isoform X2 [Sorghum bicolor]|nr:uncharacterized protein LOC110430130 isoform X2 [Sorghum bicolor]|eukprot:XP_021302832.1 uncharacterized protein LOC110430130 isoform X2 [Sorghum bicolor]
MRAFLICFRSDNHSRTKFFFLPQSMESIEGGELERDFLQALDQDMRSKQSVRNSRLIFIPVITGDGRIFVFCYNSKHVKLEFLSCKNSDESWSEGDTMCNTIFDKLEFAVDMNGVLSCHRRNCHVNWSSHMDKISDSSLLALLFMEHFCGEGDWLKDDMITDYKGIVVRYLLYHKLNEVALPEEFPRSLPQEFNEPLTNMPGGVARCLRKKRKILEKGTMTNRKRLEKETMTKKLKMQTGKSNPKPRQQAATKNL